MIIDFKPWLTHQSEPWRTLLYFLLKPGLITAALFCHSIVVNLFDMPPSLRGIVGAIVFAYLPYLSYLTYQWNKKRMRYISHFIGPWYWPLVYIPAGLGVIWLAYPGYLTPSPPEAWFALFIGVSLSHFILSAASSPRGISLFPLPYRLSLRPLKLLSKEEVGERDKQFIADFQKNHNKRNPWDRLWSEELQERSSRTHVMTIFLFIIFVFTTGVQMWLT